MATGHNNLGPNLAVHRCWGLAVHRCSVFSLVGGSHVLTWSSPKMVGGLHVSFCPDLVYISLLGCPEFVVEFNNHSINVDDSMSLTSLLHGAPHIIYYLNY